MQGLSKEIPVSTQAQSLARMLHDAYERRALDQYGYMPRRWDALPDNEKRLREEAVQEIMQSNRLLLLPACDHPEDAQTLVIRETVICGHCGAPPRLLERLAEGVAAV
jgi:hypothetical protein